MNMWKLLGIEATRDEELVRQAYRRRLPDFNPEDDQAGFLRLREACERALEYCRAGEGDGEISSPEDAAVAGLADIYADFARRIDVAAWRQALGAEIFQRIDTQQMVGEKLLLFLMDNNNLPHTVWAYLVSFFCWEERQDLLKEKFPPNFIDYVLNQSIYDDMIRYALFPLQPDFDYDTYLEYFFNINAALNQENFAHIDQQIAAAEAMGIAHPDFTLLKIRCALARNEEDAAEQMAARLYVNRPDDIRAAHALGHCRLRRGCWAEARELFQAVLAEEPEHYNARIGLAQTWYQSGELEQAKNCYWELINDNPYDSHLITAFYDINEKMAVQMEERLAAEPGSQDIIYKLASCYHNCRRFADVRALLADLEPEPEYEAKHHGVAAYAWLEAGDKARAEQEFAAWERTETDRRRLARQIPAAYLLLGQEDKALESCRRYLAEFPAEADIYDTLGSIFRQRNDWTAALEAVEKGLAANKEHLGLCILKAHILYAMNDQGGALETIESALKEYPFIVDLLGLKLRLFYEADEYEEVRSICQKIEEEGARDRIFQMYRLAAELHLAPQAETAAELREWLKDDPGESVAVNALLNYYYEGENHAAALDVLRPALTVAPDDPEFRMSLVQTLRRQELYGEALEATVWFDVNKPDYADAWNLKGLVLEAMERYDEALTAFREAIRLEPEHQVAYGNVADVMTKLGEYRRAVELLTKQLSIREHPYYYIARGLAYSFLGDTAAEKEDYFKTIELDADYAYAYNNLGITFYSEGERTEAIRYLEQAIAREADILAAHQTLGRALAESGREEEALAAWDRALAHFGQENKMATAELTREKLSFFRERGRYREGYDLLETLVRVEAMDAETMCQIAECIYEQGRLPEAWFWLERALRVADSDDPLVPLTLARYYEYAKQDFVLANLYYNKAVKAEPNEYENYIRRGRLLQSQRYKPGRRSFMAAPSYWKKPMALLDAVPAEERTPCYYYWRAECLRGQGRLAEAEKAYMQALAGAGDYALCVKRVCYDALFGLACLYEERGDLEKARKYLMETLAIKNDLGYRNFLRKLDYMASRPKSSSESVWEKLKKLFR
ncbi:MAG: tetratricopeptide repeat protein [Gracilibacteraceae bacterium]|jgi:tetratricopeptide (TPR) repeat protein|nr:tetratricopeptide repeat protein [Gracilibacteraceae bacterium]